MTIRRTLLQTLVSRVDAIEGFSCALRKRENAIDQPVTSIVYPDGEDKRLATNEQYLVTYRAELLIVVHVEDADPELDDGNEYLYLDRMVAETEKVIHAPDSWGVSPDFTDVQVTGHIVDDPSQNTELQARVFIEFTFRQNYQDPSA